jgi:hypothetical protein
MEQPPWPQDKHPWFQGEPTWPQGEPTWPQGELVAGGAFGALFDPLDHRGTSLHEKDNPGAMEALQGAI